MIDNRKNYTKIFNQKHQKKSNIIIDSVDKSLMNTPSLYRKRKSIKARKKPKQKSKRLNSLSYQQDENNGSSAETMYTETEFQQNYDKYYYEDSSPVETYEPTDSTRFTPKESFDEYSEHEEESLKSTTFEKNKMFLLYQLWLFSHLSTIISFVIYFRNVILKKNINQSNNFVYVVCLISSMWTYSLVLYRIYTTKLKTLLFTNKLSQNTMLAILPLSCLFQTENFHLIVNCALFLLSNQNKSIWKLASFAVFSWLNLANFLLYEFKSNKIEDDGSNAEKLENDNEDEVNILEAGTIQKIKDAFKPLLHLVANPLLFVITMIDMYQFFNIYKIDIRKAKSGQNKFLGIVVLSVYTVNYLLRLEYVENSRMFINFLTYQMDRVIGEELYTLMTQNSIALNHNQSLKLETESEMSTASKICFEITNFANSLWFNWIRHGINILIPLKAVNDEILKNQQHVITNVEYFGLLSKQKTLTNK